MKFAARVVAGPSNSVSKAARRVATATARLGAVNRLL